MTSLGNKQKTFLTKVTKIDLFQIKFERDNPVYYGGETLEGSVVININERLKINEVDLNISGVARVYWTEGHTGVESLLTEHKTLSSTDNHLKIVNHHAREVYLNQSIKLLKKKENEDLYLEEGEITMPFRVVLPKDLPTSFEHEVGQIRYSVNSNISIPWSLDKHVIKSFTILKDYDLNLDASLRKSYGASDSKVLCCGPCRSEPIVANFAIPKAGYVPGESISFSATIENKSKRDINELTVIIRQNLKFHSTEKTKYESRIVNVIKYPKKVKPKTNEKWEGSISIPSITPSSDETCKIIEIKYKVMLEFNAAGIHTPTYLPIPITIGTIPIKENNPVSNEPNANKSMEANGEAQPAQNEEPAKENQDTLPSFENCKFEKENPSVPKMPSNFEVKGEVVETDHNDFKPVYPFFNFPNSENQTQNETTADEQKAD